ncbi:ankyrin repeat domain-containing protein [Legionella clemsonensis]|uniref:Ankyrin repeats (3 copies) n=1 Tax=Legionella clemsonensis TaxID=1867846 RepID=A0A222P679_9GAMM|nr:ankyrin repeat domain-containing protein [Legionella clemsonensis]ASQ47307.1 Ankyrin repeats (3 copies) [Legionella clemsonensis]
MNNQLHQAAYEGDIVKIRHLILNFGYNPNQLHSVDNTTPLMAAAKGGHLEAMKALVQLGADIHYKPHTTPSLWSWAASSTNWRSIADYLMSADVQFFPSESDNQGLPLLWFLVAKKFWPAVQKALLFFNLDINAAPREGDHKGKTIAWLIATNRQCILFDFILHKYPDINIDACPAQGENKGMSILWVMAFYREWAILKKLIHRFPHANINAAAEIGPNKGTTAFWIAAQNNQWELVKEIITKFPQVNMNANPEEGRWRGMTVLWLAAKDKQWALIKEIIEKFPQANIDDYPADIRHRGISVLRLAIADNQWELVETMLTNSLQTNSDAPYELVLQYSDTLRILAREGRLDLALLILESRKFFNISMELLTSTQYDCLTFPSFLQWAFQNNNKVLIEKVVLNCLVRGLLEFNHKRLLTRKGLDLLLKRQEEELLGKLFNKQTATSEAQQSAKNVFHQSSMSILNLFDSLECIWNLSSLSYFNIYSMPDEIRFHISQIFTASLLPLKLNNSLMNELLNFFIESHIKNERLKQEVLEEKRQFCFRLATLAFRKWRHEHMNFFYEEKNREILRIKTKDYHNMIYDGLCKILVQANEEITFDHYRKFLENYRNAINSSTVQKHIIDAIAQLELKDFKPSILEKIIAQAFNHFVKESKLSQSRSQNKPSTPLLLGKRKAIADVKGKEREETSNSFSESNLPQKKRKYFYSENQSRHQKEQTLGKRTIREEVESEENHSLMNSFSQ